MDQPTGLSPLDNNDTGKKKITFSSRQKWFWLAIVITIINPIFAGLILGLALLTEPEAKKEARTILALAIIWGVIYYYLVNWLTTQGYLPAYY